MKAGREVPLVVSAIAVLALLYWLVVYCQPIW